MGTKRILGTKLRSKLTKPKKHDSEKKRKRNLKILKFLSLLTAAKLLTSREIKLLPRIWVKTKLWGCISVPTGADRAGDLPPNWPSFTINAKKPERRSK